MNEFSDCPTEGVIGLLALLIQSGRLAESRLDRELDTAGLTFVKWRTLDTLVKADAPIALKMLPGELHCVKSNVTQLVDKLEDEKWVVRAPDAEDRRSILVELTQAGRDAHRAGAEALKSATRSLFEGFLDEELALLRRLLGQLPPG